MPAAYSIQKENRVVFTYGWGVLAKDDIVAHRDRLASDPRFQLDYRQIVDLRDTSSFDVSSTSVWLLAEEAVFAAESRRAFVTASDLHFGMSRMFQSYGGGQNVRSFRGLAEAAEWVGVSVKIADEAFREIRAANGVG